MENPEGSREALFRRDFEKALQAKNRVAGKPYEIHASCGMCKPENLSGDIQRYVNIADAQMYSNKRKYKDEHPYLMR